MESKTTFTNVSHVGVNQCFSLFSAFQYRLQKSGIFGRMSERRARSKLSFEKRTELLHAFSSSLFPVLVQTFAVISFYSNLCWRQDLTGRRSKNKHVRKQTHMLHMLHMPSFTKHCIYPCTEVKRRKTQHV